MCKIIAVVNNKGGLGKTTNTINLGAGLSVYGKRVLLVDGDPSGNATIGLGFQKDAKRPSLATLLTNIMMNMEFDFNGAVLKHSEGMDLIPTNGMLEQVELMISMPSEDIDEKKFLLKRLLDVVRDSYDYILIDCRPTLSALVVNALVAADSVLIPVQPEYYAVDGMQTLLRTISHIKEQYNNKLIIEGILYTMDKEHTSQSKAYKRNISEAYGKNIHIFNTNIPFRVAISEAVNYGKSIFEYAKHDRNARPAAERYTALTEEVLQNG